MGELKPTLSPENCFFRSIIMLVYDQLMRFNFVRGREMTQKFIFAIVIAFVFSAALLAPRDYGGSDGAHAQAAPCNPNIQRC